MGNYLPEGRILTSTENRNATKDLDALAETMQKRTIAEGMVLRCDRNQTLYIKLGDRIGIIPREETALGIEDGTVSEFSVLARVGKPVSFHVTALEANNGTITPILSRKSAQQEALSQLRRLPVGSVIPATVTHLEQFGAFVDVGCGLISMIPIALISTSRIRHPRQRFQVGQTIPVVFLGYDEESKHILLSHRELLGTWEENAKAFQAGDTVTGIIRGIKDYGIFVELTPNLTGLSEYRDGLEEDQLVSVYIKAILPEKHKIKLNIIDTLDSTPVNLPMEYPPLPDVVQPWAL